MNIKCPLDDTHKQFIATAHVTQEWVVDEHGNFINLFGMGFGGECQVTHAPDSRDLFQCADCMEDAVVSE